MTLTETILGPENDLDRSGKVVASGEESSERISNAPTEILLRSREPREVQSEPDPLRAPARLAFPPALERGGPAGTRDFGPRPEPIARRLLMLQVILLEFQIELNFCSFGHFSLYALFFPARNRSSPDARDISCVA